MTIIYIILAALTLGILVFFHELGHYFVARRTGMVVEVFSIGFGRPLLKWTWHGVSWQIGWLPFGGYVKILGMEFSKKERLEPYEVQGGFFSKPPLSRMAVALAGPVANFLLALLIFCLLWLIGGREKPFSDYTHIVGFVDPTSEIYALGLRPGDVITTYNGQPYRESKDLLYAAMLTGDKVTFTGEHVDYQTGERTPFNYTISPYPLKGAIEEMQTTGVQTMARYLINESNPQDLTKHSPMEGSGILPGDRLVWADGELLFSQEQLSAIANSSLALLTVKRAEQTFLARIPRVSISDLVLPTQVRGDLEDWRYELRLSDRGIPIYTLPYLVDEEGVVEGRAQFIDKWSKADALSEYGIDETSLKKGDRILAIDGQTITKGMDILSFLQTRRVSLIVERDFSLMDKGSWKQADETFDRAWDAQAITLLGNRIGTEASKTEGRYQLLTSVEPKSLFEIPMSEEERTRLDQEYAAKLAQVETIKEASKRQAMLEAIKSAYHRKIFGLALVDRLVRFNPNPLAMFGAVFAETWHTLKALVMGYLHPKWLSGPVGIVRVIGHGWQMGPPEALFWIGAISVNLGFLNLMPIPVLDGGYICLSLWELITRRRLKARTMERIVVPFVVLLIALLVFLTFQDLARLF